MSKSKNKSFSHLNNLQTLVLSVFLGSMMIVACEGPQGPQGPEGPQGPQGDQGPQGEEGTANVIYSDWMTPDTWEPAELFGDSVRHGDIIADDLTQDIVDNGEVEVYGDFYGSDFIYKLPVDPSMAGITFTLSYKFKPDTLRLEFFDPDNPNTDPGSLPSSNKFRYVLIPGGQSAGSSANNAGDILKEISYEELKQRFDIPDEGSGVIRDVNLK